jgi:rubrerythrin
MDDIYWSPGLALQSVESRKGEPTVAASMTEREILKMAMKMEEIGRGFYQALAFGSDNPEVRSFCIRASREEARHFATLKALHDTWGRSSTRSAACLDEDDECVQLAREQILPNPVAVHRTAIGGDLEAALDMAIRLKTDAIHFYEGMFSSFPAAGAVLHIIIVEEASHLRSLDVLKTRARAA